MNTLSGDSTACEVHQIISYSISECDYCNPEELSSQKCLECYLTHLGVMKDEEIQDAAFEVFRYSSSRDESRGSQVAGKTEERMSLRLDLDTDM